jgi:hypothetical protein
MIVHVAAAGEARGRVVLQLGTGEPSPLALEAAVRLAQAFNAEVESLFVVDQQLLQLASYPFAREISLTGRQRRPITTTDIERDLRFVSQAAQRRLQEIAAAVEVRVETRTVRAEPQAALVEACAACGPWNVVALGHAVTSAPGPAVSDLLQTISDATGIVLVGPKSRRARGPVVAVIEDEHRMSGLLAAAERLAAACADPEGPGEIVLLVTSDDPLRLEWLEGHARLLGAGRDTVRVEILDTRLGAIPLLSEVLRRCASGFVIAAMGGVAIPDETDLRLLAATVECPLLNDR